MSRFESVQTPNGLEIKIKPVNEGRFQTYFLGFWLVAWAFGWISGVTTLLSGPIGFDSLFMLVWTVFWTLGGFFAGLWLAWKTNGFEQVLVNSSNLKIKHNIFGFGPEKEYSSELCQNLRAAGYFGSDRNHSILHQIGMRGGVVAVDCSGEAVRFGVALEESEAQDIVNLIKPYIKT